LRLVASKLSRVTGGGQAYRCGGEEFAILFPGKTTPEVVDHLEQLRASIEAGTFRLRGGDRREGVRGPDRRNPRPRAQTQANAIRQVARTTSPTQISVTASIGVATALRENSTAEEVVQSADKALYRAKAGGRNRIETATSARRRRTRAKAAGSA
jgi:GGDEF domain-containing protein